MMGNVIRVATERYNHGEIEEVLNKVGITSKNEDGSYKTIYMILSEVSDVFSEINNEILEIQKCITKYKEIMRLSEWMEDDFTIKAKQKIQFNINTLNHVSIGLVGNRNKNQLICLLIQLHNI